MNPSNPHLSGLELDDFAARRMPSEALLAADRHLESCAACRSAVETRIAAGPLPKLHLTYEDLVEVMAGTASPALARHAVGCELCRADLAELQKLRKVRTFPLRTPLAIAAGLVLAVAGLVFRARRAEPVPASVSIPPILESLRPRGTVFLGSADAPQGIRPLRPYATVTPTGQPEFAWESPVAGPFEVEVFDPEFRRVANSGPIDTSSWTPSTALPRGMILTWRVTARSTGLTGPRAPEPEARFVVLDEAAAAKWNAKSGHEGPVALGVDALRLGMRQEALRLWSTEPRTAELRKSIDW